MTIMLSALGFIFSAIIAVPLSAARSFGPSAVRYAIGGLTSVAQGLPVPVLMFIVYFGAAEINPSISPVAAAVMAMTIFSCAYLVEIWRGALQSIDRTQWQAAESLGMGKFQIMVWIIAPQAVRRAIPPTTGFLVQVIKNTAYAMVIGAYELTDSARLLNNTMFQPFLIFTIVAAMYFACCYPISLLAKRLEAHYAKY